MTFTKVPTLPYSELGSFIERLGFDPKMVLAFTMTPSDVTITSYRPDADGSKFVDPETGEAAVEVVLYKVAR